MPPELLTTRELAERLDVEPGDILTWHGDGRIRPVGKVRNREYVWSVPAVIEQLRRFHAERREREAVAS